MFPIVMLAAGPDARWGTAPSAVRCVGATSRAIEVPGDRTLRHRPLLITATAFMCFFFGQLTMVAGLASPALCIGIVVEIGSHSTFTHEKLRPFQKAAVSSAEAP